MSRGRVKRLAAVLGTALALSVYGLAIAPSALAASCTFSGGVLTVTMTGADAAELQISAAPNNPIQLNGVDAVCTGGNPLLSTTTAINVVGDATGAQTLTIDLADTDTFLHSWGKINWTVNLGADTLTPDGLFVYNEDTRVAGAIDLVAGANGIDLNNDGDVDVTLAGVDRFQFWSDSAGDDSISGAGSTATGAAFPNPIQGLDGPGGTVGITAANNTALGANYLTGGASQDEVGDFSGDYDIVAGGLGDDRLDGYAVDFGGSAAGVTVNLPAGTAVGEGLDTLVVGDVFDVYGSPQADSITGTDGEDNWIWGGLGDDTLNGGVGATVDDDTADYAGSNGVEVDLAAGTATGDHGTDTLANFESAEGGSGNDKLSGTSKVNNLYGLSGNDKLIGHGGGDHLVGGSGVDTAQYGWATTANVHLAGDDPATVAVETCSSNGGSATYTGATGTDSLVDIENARLTSGDDSFTGSDFQNTVLPAGGQNTLNGDCGLSNSGGDTLDYSKGYNGDGVTVNMAGGATAGDSATNFEAAIGSNGPDSITGNEMSNSIKGGKGADNILGGSGDDNLKGGKGKDSIRGGSGDDNLWGNGGKDQGFGGNGDDWGKGLEKAVSIELGPSA